MESEQEKAKTTASISDYLAAERTFLAWIRTGLALMGFGFVAARFGLFLRMLEAGQRGAASPTSSASGLIGTAIVVLGVFVTLLSTWQHMRQVRQLDTGGAGIKTVSLL